MKVFESNLQKLNRNRRLTMEEYEAERSNAKVSAGRPKKFRPMFRDATKGLKNIRKLYLTDLKRARANPRSENLRRIAKQSMSLYYKELRRQRWNRRQLPEYDKELSKFLKSFKWKWFGTATFDRRIKTPLNIYDHNVVMGEYSKYLPEGWEPSTWEPSVETTIQMMEAFMMTLEKKSYKRFKMFYAIEEHKDGTPHVHFIIGNDRSGGRDVELMSRIWRWLRGGYIRIDEIKGGNTHIDYVMKYVTKEMNSWDFLTTKTNWLRYKNIPKNVFEINTFLKFRKHRINIIKSGKKWYI